MTNVPIDYREVILAGIEAAKRRKYLASFPVVCPKCQTRQIQLIGIEIPAEWNCRHCREFFIYEP